MREITLEVALKDYADNERDIKMFKLMVEGQWKQVPCSYLSESLELQSKIAKIITDLGGTVPVDEIEQLRAQVAELTADRDSESRWAKEYLKRAEAAEADADRLAQIITSTIEHCPDCGENAWKIFDATGKLTGMVLVHDKECSIGIDLATHETMKAGKP
jgi:hypothetical protein